MTEVKSKKVTFDTALPRGVCATFTHEGTRWIAYPQEKAQQLDVVMNKMIATVDRVNEGLIEWINAHPEDAAKVVRLITKVNSAQELAREKAQAWTM